MSYWLYNIIIRVLFAFTFPMFLVFSLVTGKHGTGLLQRLGYYPQLQAAPETGQRIWLHAASVGEIKVANILIREIIDAFPEATLYVTTVTEQGQEVARKQLPAEVQCLFAPLDLPGVVHRAIKHIKPTIYICLETELWPNLLRQVHKSGARLFLLNGRISVNSFKKYRKIKKFMKKVLSYFTALAVIQPGDVERFAELGAAKENIRVLGNAKYSLEGNESHLSLQKKFTELFGLQKNQFVFVSGSTHTGEELQLINVYLKLKEHLENLVWITAPRHIQRLPELESQLLEKDLEYSVLSDVKKHGRRHSIIVVDTVGELAQIYSVGTFIFCGGSLVDRGGHNLMEAAMWGKPVFYGPNIKDFADAADLLETNGAGIRINCAEELAEKILDFSRNMESFQELGNKARQIIESQENSARKQIELIKSNLIH